jgi:hypothetical protein
MHLIIKHLRNHAHVQMGSLAPPHLRSTPCSVAAYSLAACASPWSLSPSRIPLSLRGAADASHPPHETESVGDQDGSKEGEEAGYEEDDLQDEEEEAEGGEEEAEDQ